MSTDPSQSPADRPHRLIVVAYNVRSLGNVGSLFRLCDGAGVSELVLAGFTGTPPDRRIDKVALDSVEMVPWRQAEDRAALEEIFAGRFVVVLEQHATSVAPGQLSVPLDRDVVIVACEELFGAESWLIERADAVLELPMRGGKDSLNVAIATGIASYLIADLMWGTAPQDLASRQNRPPVREGVLTKGVTHGETRAEVPPPKLGTRTDR